MAWHLYRPRPLVLPVSKDRSRRLGLLLVLAGADAATLAGKTSDQFSMPGIESTQAFDLIEQRTPDAAPDGATARIAVQRLKAENRRLREDVEILPAATNFFVGELDPRNR